jgi:outer membrane murein-binding lipoprotein Lpp
LTRYGSVMSNSQKHEEVSVSSEGVTVLKRFEADEFPVPAIAFEFTSTRDETVTVTLTDAVPDSVAVEDLGFHPEYGSEFWTIDEKEIRFENELDPGAEYTTVYGIRATGTENVEKFLTEPALESVEPPLSGADDAPGDSEVVPKSEEDIVSELLSGEGDVPGLGPDDESEQDDDSEGDVDTLDLAEPGDSGPEATEGDSAQEVTVEGDSLVAALAAEIREQEVSAADIELLRDAFELVSDGSTDARMERLQADVADLRAYTDALEEFLDENGTAEQLIEEMESRTADTAERVDDVEDEIESVSDSLDDVEATVSELESDLESVREQVTEENVVDRIEEMESAVDDIQEWQKQLKGALGG